MTHAASLQHHKTRTYDYTVTDLDLAAAQELSGLDYIRAMISGEISGQPSIAATMNMSAPLAVDFGKAAMEADPADFLLNPMGTMHGGFAATLLDSVLGISIHTSLPAGMGYTTAELKVNYVRPVRTDTGRLRAEANLIHAGRRLATAEGRLIGIADGKLYAHGSTTCLIFPLGAAAPAG